MVDRVVVFGNRPSGTVLDEEISAAHSRDISNPVRSTCEA